MTLEELSDYFRSEDNYMITAHEAPDGDAIGAEIALYAALKKLDKNVNVINTDQSEEKYSFLNTDSILKVYKPDKGLDIAFEETTLVILDTAPDNIGILGDSYLKDFKKVLVIDHHDDREHPKDGYFDHEASSCCEILYNVFQLLEIEFDLLIAEALFTGIVYDTGSFKYPKTKASTFRIAEDLMSYGVIPYDINSHIYESKSKASLLLNSRVIGTLLLYYNDKIAVITMPRSILLETGAHYEEAQELINIPLQCLDVEVSVFLKENEYGLRRCSLRSKGHVDCQKIARYFSGGGHKTAAGFKFAGSFSEIKKQVLEEISLLLP